MQQHAEILTRILSQYGEPPRIGEHWETAYYKLIVCVTAMEDEIKRLRGRKLKKKAKQSSDNE